MHELVYLPLVIPLFVLLIIKVTEPENKDPETAVVAIAASLIILPLLLLLFPDTWRLRDQTKLEYVLLSIGTLGGILQLGDQTLEEGFNIAAASTLGIYVLLQAWKWITWFASPKTEISSSAASFTPPKTNYAMD